jgi:pyruvate/2-oxoglutarate dehydrogenase complex dihydrolipoamide dehydrogenase (E3) component/uncharacterized membrane protein YdjX (TVP38/TMEM64 family)
MTERSDTMPALTAAGAPARRLPWKPILAAVVVLAALLTLGRSIGGALPAFAAWLEGQGAWGPIVFIAGYVLAVLLFAPGSILTLAAGALFGLLRGVLYVFIAATLGAAGSFLVARYVARPYVEKRLAGNPKLAAIDRAIGVSGRKIVFLLRLSPVFPFNLLNYALGLTRVRFADYVLASVGMLPGTLLYVYYGKLAGDVAALAAGVEADRGPGYYAVLALGLGATLVATALVTRAARRALREATAEAEPAAAPPAGPAPVPERPILLPLDDHNRRHLASVRPEDHVNPRPRERYHLVVIGAGPGGLVTAIAAAGLGARVALIERHMMGGDCLNVGCVPSKGILRAARAWHEAARGADEFGAPRVAGTGDFAAAMRRMRKLRADLSPVDSVRRYTERGVDVFLGEGRFLDPDTIGVGGARLKFRRAVIATGARAAMPPVPGLKEAEPLTNETVFWLEELPARLAIIGSGPIGCELAQAFARFGSRVTVMNRGDRILPREDRDAARIVEAALARDGVTFAHGTKLLRVERRGEERVIHCERGGRAETIVVDRILVAAGRAPNVERLALEAGGVRFTPRGIDVDDRLRTSNRKVYAIGDVASPYQFTHVADAQARLVIANALFFGRGRASRLVIPWCTYTSPEVAHVGMSEDDAVRAGMAVDTITVPLHDLDRAVLEGATEGFARVHLRKGTDRILGATLVAKHAGDMIGELALAITAGVGLSAIGRTIHPYPTSGEVIRKTADAWRRTKLTPFAKKVFERFFRIVN